MALKTKSTTASTPAKLCVAGLVGDSIVDGPGLRFTVFCQGCPHACPGCHNPATHPFQGGTMLTPQEILQRLKEYPLCRAVTLSGGEPFSQAEVLSQLAATLRQAGYCVDAYSGYTFEQLMQGTPEQQRLLSHLDVLVDGKYVEAKRSLSLRFRGSENQRILNIPQSLAAGHAVEETAERWTGITTG